MKQTTQLHDPYTVISFSRQLSNVCFYFRYRFQPRILSARDVKDRTTTTLLGASVRIPICISPTAAQYSVAPPKGDILTGLATLKEGSLMVLSSHADVTIENFASEVCPSDGVFWAQTYLFRDRRNTLHVVKNAERLGFRAIMVTVDSPTDFTATSGRSDVTAEHLDPTDRDSAPNIKFLHGKKRENRNYTEDEMWSGNSGAGEIETFCHPTWEDFYWLKSQTKLPIVIKGILSAHAAREAVKAGVGGILVSAHGGRQLEGSPASLDALVEVVDAVRGSNVEIYMDGGVRSGTDVLKALALGARAVFIGRPAIWGLAVNVRRYTILGIDIVTSVVSSICVHHRYTLNKGTVFS
ncbi:Hydroxyacid oxidase 1 [Holothuria leucospilota]|uniref:Hydroxyacid oxidase 1 n=1 Tax=Holothuria leucospilota TaxID=206669 RepID=A0A9Q1BIX4_HOLLE|nr:Hydroxyacid oxidase 1 [Holothuria leucospilota]